MNGTTTYNPAQEDLGSFFANGRARLAEKRNRPTAKLVLYRTDAVVSRKGWKPACADIQSIRGIIGRYPSARSLQNLVFLLNNCDEPMQSMLTLTMTPRCNAWVSPAVHRHAFKLALQRLRDKGITHWCWVREFQKNNSVHWHVFTGLKVGAPGEVNDDLSHDWRMWWSSLYWDKLIGEAGTKDVQRRHNISRARMERGNKVDFHGCCRFEQLLTEAAGRYAAKEGAKRFQKLAPEAWEFEGGAWWRASKSVIATPVGEKRIDADKLNKATVRIKGKETEIAFRLQYGAGLKHRTDQ